MTEQLEVLEAVAPEAQLYETGEPGVAAVLTGEPKGRGVAAVLHDLLVHLPGESGAKLLQLAVTHGQLLYRLRNKLYVHDPIPVLERVVGNVELAQVRRDTGQRLREKLQSVVTNVELVQGGVVAALRSHGRKVAPRELLQWSG